MKKWRIFLGLMMVSTIILAQRKADPMDRAEKRAEKMKTELSLDDVQFKAVKAINEDFAGKQSQVWRDSTLSKEAKRTQLRKLGESRKEAVAKVLTEEQKAKWASYRSEEAKKRQAKMASRRKAHVEQMQHDLALTNDQMSKIKALDQEFGTKFRALRADSTIAREDAHEKAKLLRLEYRSKTKAVLTDEQLQKWEIQKKAAHKRRRF